MDEEDRQEAIRTRDEFNERISPVLRGKYANIKKGQDKMNYYFNLEINPPPEPTDWTGDICEKSIKLPRKYCIHVKETTLPVKPANPTLCDLHKTPSYPPKIRELHAHFLGYWNWFRVNAWPKAQQKQAEIELLETAIETKKHRFAEVDSFGWLSSGKQEHRHMNWRTPWVWEKINGKRLFHLDIFEERFFELFEAFLNIHKIVNLDFAMHLFMSFGYNDYPFRNNTNGVTRFWSDKAIPFQQAFADKIMATYEMVYGENYKPWVKIINEASHGGNTEMFHRIMDFHKEIWDALKQYTDLQHTIVDISHCEGALGKLREPHKCPKCGQMHGTDGYDRLAMGEVHGFSTITDFKRGVDGGTKEIIDIYYGSANKRRRFTEDAGGISKDGKGEVWGPYVFADKDQCYKMAKYVYGKGNRIVLCPFSVECLKKLVENNKVIYRSDYRVSQIHWDRFKEIARAWDETR